MPMEHPAVLPRNHSQASHMSRIAWDGGIACHGGNYAAEICHRRVAEGAIDHRDSVVKKIAALHLS